MQRLELGMQHGLPAVIDRYWASGLDTWGIRSSGAPSTGKGWRLHFLGGVALGVLLLSAGDPAYAQCSIVGGLQNCGGDLSDGVVVSDPAITYLDIDDLTGDIAPAEGIEGVKFESDGPIVVMIDLGENSIDVDGANGVQVRSFDGDDVSVTNHGAILVGGGLGIYLTTAGSLHLDNEGIIESDGDSIRVVNESATGGGTTRISQEGNLRSVEGYGIYSEGQNATYIDSEGAIHSDRDSIHVKVGAEGTVDVEHKGSLTSDSGYGVNVTEAHGNVYIDVEGDIDSGLDGIYAHSSDFDSSPPGASILSVDHVGLIDAGGAGINVSTSNAMLHVDNKGSIVSVGTGVKLKNDSTQASLVDQVGAITSAEGEGVNVSGRGYVEIKTVGAVISKLDGLNGVSAEGNVEIEHEGNITSSAANGVYAEAANGTIDVIVSDGDISASKTGIYTTSGGANTVELNGNITKSATGIYAKSTNGSVAVSVIGDVTAEGDGIFAENDSSDKVKIDQTGDLDVGGAGVYAYSASGEIEVDQHGVITAGGNGIFAGNTGDRAINIEHTGDISSVTANGIYATSSGGAITIKSTDGDLNVVQTGIYAGSTGSSAVSIEFEGNITKSAVAISGYSSNGGVSIVSEGSLTANGDGIVAKNEGDADISVNHSGSINAGGIGIDATTPGGAVTVTNDGTIDAVGDAIRAATESDKTVTVTNTGNLVSTTGSGIWATSSNGVVGVTSKESDISAAEYGIYAQSEGSGSVTVLLGGDILESDTGIFASSAQGKVKVTHAGAITSDIAAIIAANTSSASVTVIQDGNVNSGGDGISAISPDGVVSVDVTGDLDVAGFAIFAQSEGDSSATVNLTGDIINSAKGVEALSGRGAVTVTTVGDLKSSGDVLTAGNLGDATVRIDHSGNIVSTGGNGVVATSTTGIVNVDVTSDVINVAGTAIRAGNVGNTAVTVDFTGNVTGSANAIEASSANGAVTVTTIGDLVSSGDTITASNLGTGKITVDHTGDITSTEGSGVVVTSTTTRVDIGIAGDIDVDLTAIVATTVGSEAINIAFDGRILASTRAIVASSAVGMVDIDTKGSITSTGDAITATNLGGQPINIAHEGDLESTGGNAIVASSTDAVITVTLDKGEVTALKDAVKLTSTADLDVLVGADGIVTGGAGFAAINLEQGYQNTITNYGTIRTAGTTVDNAIKATSSENIINNYGTISGSVDVGVWANAFNNFEGALFESGSVVKIGDDSILSNAGTISPGGDGIVQTTALTGSLTNTETGTLVLDLDMATGNSDRITVSNTADLDGALRLNFVDLGAVGSTYTILTAANGIGIQNLTMANPMVLYDIDYTNGTQVDVTINGFDFAPAGVTGNAADIGNYIGGAIAGGSSDLYAIGLALLQLPTLDSVQNALTQLSPNVYLAEQYSSLFGSVSFADNLMSCRVPGGVAKFSTDGQCVWAKTGYRWLDHDGSAATGFKDRTWDVSGGAQFAADPDWRIGAAFGVTGTDRAMDGGATSDGNAVQFGAVVKYVPGPMLLAASLSGSYGWYDTKRSIDIGDFSDRLEGSPETGTLNGRLRAAYTFETGDVYLKPQVDFNATYSHTSAFTESGGAASVSINGGGATVYSIAPSVEIGGQRVLANGMALRPFVRGGVTAYSEDGMSVSGSFAADSSGQDPFTISSDMDDVVWNVAAGMDAFATNGGALRVFYNGNFSKDMRENAVGLKFKLDY